MLSCADNKKGELQAPVQDKPQLPADKKLQTADALLVRGILVDKAGEPVRERMVFIFPVQ